jgi:hypothetical protein
MECRGNVGLARLDPMMSPGTASQHSHVIHGSSGKSIPSSSHVEVPSVPYRAIKEGTDLL